MSDRFQQLRQLEALLFAAAEPQLPKVLAKAIGLESGIDALLEELAGHYANRGVTLVQSGDAYAFRTAADLAHLFTREERQQRRLSRAAVESLAVVAYHQPVTRAEIEEIRGVALSKGTLDVLLEAGWIKPGQRRETPGRPVTWLTTPAFLDHFGLAGLGSLPGIEELKAAGLLDTRPAITALSERGLLAPAAELANDDREDEPVEDDPLDADFGEDLVQDLTPAPEDVPEAAAEAEEETPDASGSAAASR
jgi:segregation and condensation protein B